MSPKIYNSHDPKKSVYILLNTHTHTNTATTKSRFSWDGWRTVERIQGQLTNATKAVTLKMILQKFY